MHALGVEEREAKAYIESEGNGRPTWSLEGSRVHSVLLPTTIPKRTAISKSVLGLRGLMRFTG